MRYVQKRKLADGKTHYRFNPPQTLVDEGVVKRKELGTDLRIVKVAANQFNEKINGLEDLDWARKIQGIGNKIVYESNSKVFHFHGINQNTNLKRLKRHIQIIKKII